MKRIFAVCMMACSLTAVGANIDFTISMSGGQETPVTGSFAAGGGIATYDDVLNQISVNVFFVGLAAPATASHIHDGAAGVPGGVIVSFVPFTPSATAGSITGGPLAFPSANIADLLAGKTYFNIHDSVFPGGEIRGQLLPVIAPEPSSLALLGVGLGAGALLRRRR